MESVGRHLLGRLGKRIFSWNKKRRWIAITLRFKKALQENPSAKKKFEIGSHQVLGIADAEQAGKEVIKMLQRRSCLEEMKIFLKQNEQTNESHKNSESNNKINSMELPIDTRNIACWWQTK